MLFQLTFEDNNEDDDAESGSLDGEGDGAETEIDNGEEKSEIDISDNVSNYSRSV